MLPFTSSAPLTLDEFLHSNYIAWLVPEPMHFPRRRAQCICSRDLLQVQGITSSICPPAPMTQRHTCTVMPAPSPPKPHLHSCKIGHARHHLDQVSDGVLAAAKPRHGPARFWSIPPQPAWPAPFMPLRQHCPTNGWTIIIGTHFFRAHLCASSGPRSPSPPCSWAGNGVISRGGQVTGAQAVKCEISVAVRPKCQMPRGLPPL